MTHSPGNDGEVLAFLGRLEAADQAAAPVAAGKAYKAAEITRLNRHWQPLSYAGDEALAEGWELAARRIQDLDRNDPAFQALQRTLVDHTIGAGILTLADVQILDGPPDEEAYNDEVDTYIEQWEEESDGVGEEAWGDQQRQAMREMLGTGDALLLRVQRKAPQRLIPLSYQVLESAQLDESVDRAADERQNAIRRGIEYDADGRAVAYHLFDVHPSDPYARNPTKSARIPAERILHCPLPGRPSQHRGMSLYAAITQPTKDLDTLLGSELTSGIIASLMTLVWKTKSGQGTSGFGFAGDGSDTSTTDAYGNPILRLGHGVISRIGIEDDVKVMETANRPSSQAKTFVDLILMLMGMGGNCSRYSFCRDFSGITYIAARAAMIHDEIGHRPLQKYVWRRICRPVYRDVVTQLAAHGKLSSLSASQFRRQRRRWTQCEPLFPAIPLLDMEAETDAILGLLGAGLTTHKEACGRLGKHWRRVLKQKAREEKYAGSLNLTLDYGRPSKPTAPDGNGTSGDGSRGDARREARAQARHDRIEMRSHA